MSVRITGVEYVLGPWVEHTSTEQRRAAVIEAIADAAERFDELFQQPAPLGDNPLVRWIDVPQADVTIRILLPHPNRGVHLLGIFDAFDDELSNDQ